MGNSTAGQASSGPPWGTGVSLPEANRPGSGSTSWSGSSLKAALLRKPLWLAGAGLAGGWLLLAGVQEVAGQLGELLPLAVAMGGAGLWLATRRTARPAPVPTVSDRPLQRADVLTAIARGRAIAEVAAQEVAQFVPAVWEARWTAIEQQLDRPEVTLAIAGVAAAGKTALRQALEPKLAAQASATPSPTKVHWRELPNRLGETSAAELLPADLEAIDQLLWILPGDLTAMELAAIDQWVAAGFEPWVVLNKRDRLLPDQVATVLDHVRHELAGIVAAENILTAAAAPSAIKVRRHQADGTVLDSLEQPAPDVSALAARLVHWQQTASQTARWAKGLRQATATQQEILASLATARRDRAWPLVEQSQWVAAATAFANPVPALDLLATAAVNAQLIFDVGQIYRQSFGMDRAAAVAKTLAEVLLKLGLVEAGSQAIALSLKASAATFPAAYLAGGAVQGISAAYLTRVAGTTLIEVFQGHAEAELLGAAPANDGTWLSPERLTGAARAAWQRLGNRPEALQGFVRQAIDQLSALGRFGTA